MSSKLNQAESSGVLGKTVSMRKKRGKVFFTDSPARKPGKLSEKQHRRLEQFDEAAKYASRQILKPEVKALYARGINEKRKTEFQVALSDYIIAPKVSFGDTRHYKGVVGGTILVKAVDDFMVTKVEVIITNAAGTVIEEGEAVLSENNTHQWVYTATAANPTLAGTIIRAIAYDRPGNSGEAEVTL